MRPAGKVSGLGLSSRLAPGTSTVASRGELLYFDVLTLEHLEQLHVAVQCAGSLADDVGSRAFERGFLHGALALQVVVLKEVLGVLREISDRGEQRGLLVIVVVALRPVDDGQRGILAVPGAGVFLRREDALFGVGAAVAEGFVEAARCRCAWRRGT